MVATNLWKKPRQLILRHTVQCPYLPCRSAATTLPMGAADPSFSLSCASTSVALIFPVAASAFEAAEMIPSCSNVKGLPVGGVF